MEIVADAACGLRFSGRMEIEMKRKFFIESGDPLALIEIMECSSHEDIDIYKVSVKLPEKGTPPKIRISWEEDMVDILHVWTPLGGAGSMHQWFAPTEAVSRFNFGAPVLATIGDGDKNRETVSVSDADNPVHIGFCIKDIDQQNKVGYFVEFFRERADTFIEYEAEIRIDCRKLPFYETVMSVYPWWKEFGYVIPEIPAEAEDALYSTWYNFHQAPKDKALVEDLKIASELGFRTVILDDGWQFPGPSSGDYSLCGEWVVAEDKFEDFKDFVDTVHSLGMKLMVWFSVPFVGIYSPFFEKFKDKYLRVDYGLMNEGTLDPRFPEVREYIKDNYKRFLKDYDIDGFKFDFIDSFTVWDDSKPYDSSVMDCETVDNAVNKLMTEIVTELAEIKSDLLYEYRQNYIGPAINRFGNMLRVGDCAYEAQANRIGVTDIRLLNYPTAVHSDMLFWAPSESLKMCKRQLLNILFSVPQISVILKDSTAEQTELLRNYLSYWKRNREILLHGRFKALYPEQRYSYISSENEEKMIAVIHGDLPFRYFGKICDVFHNGNVDGIIVENCTEKTLKVNVFEDFNEISVSEIEIKPNEIVRVGVSQTGMVRIQ